MNEKRKQKKNFYSGSVIVWLLFTTLAAMMLNGCRNASTPEANSSASRSAMPSPTPQSAFERDLKSVRSSQTFTKIYVFARKDGAAIGSEDGNLLKAKAPADPHIWWVVTDEKRRVIMGTYSDFAPEKLNALRQHFTVEDYTDR